METKLKQDFTDHYGLAVSNIGNISISTTEPYFEIEDDANGVTQLHLLSGMGQAVFRNNNQQDVTIINFDKFITSLPQNFQHGKKRCDLVIHTDTPNHFLLCELKDRKIRPNVRSGAIKQLKESLVLIMAVHAISSFANTYTHKKCCFFNKQARPPASLTVLNGFNRINTIAQNGLQIPDSTIESLGFELFDSSGGYRF